MSVYRLDVLNSLINKVIAAFVCDQTLNLFLLLSLFLFIFFSGWCRSLIYPLNGAGFLNHRIFVIWRWNRSHLRIHKRISQEELLAGICRILIRKFIPLVRDIQVVQVLQTVFIQRQLMNECGSDLEVWPTAIQEFEGFEEGPLILAHDVACEGAGCPALTPDRVYEH